jgi:membrane dipeptidase
MRPNTTHWPTLDEFIEMIDYVVQMTGSTDNVGIGTDMSLGTYPDHHSDPWGAPEIPNITEQYDRHVTDDIRSHMRNVSGFSDYAEIVDVAERLSSRGYSDEDVHKFLGENFMRVFDEVWT